MTLQWRKTNKRIQKTEDSEDSKNSEESKKAESQFQKTDNCDDSDDSNNSNDSDDLEDAEDSGNSKNKRLRIFRRLSRLKRRRRFGRPTIQRIPKTRRFGRFRRLARRSRLPDRSKCRCSCRPGWSRRERRAAGGNVAKGVCCLGGKGAALDGVLELEELRAVPRSSKVAGELWGEAGGSRGFAWDWPASTASSRDAKLIFAEV